MPVPPGCTGGAAIGARTPLIAAIVAAVLPASRSVYRSNQPVARGRARLIIRVSAWLPGALSINRMENVYVFNTFSGNAKSGQYNVA